MDGWGSNPQSLKLFGCGSLGLGRASEGPKAQGPVGSMRSIELSDPRL